MLIPENYFEICLRLTVAVILGGIIGSERAGTNHEAGLRTHMLLCLGAASVMVTSEAMAVQFGIDVSRMGAQVISGIGFLGVGSIIVNGNKVRGLTTAAGLWTTACAGIAVGIGYYAIAGTVVLLMLLAMLAFRPLATYLQKKGGQTICIIHMILTEKSCLHSVTACFIDHDMEVHSIQQMEQADGTVSVEVKLRCDKELSDDKLVCRLMDMDGVRRVEKI